MQIDDVLARLDSASGDLEHLREEKDQEIAILQEGMDHTLQQLSEVHQVCFWRQPISGFVAHNSFRIKA
jgi:hypothetical protein